MKSDGAVKKTAAKKRAAKKRAAKKTPDVLGALKSDKVKVRQVGTGETVTIPRAEWEARVVQSQTASQIADSLEVEAKKFQGLADILRGKTA